MSDKTVLVTGINGYIGSHIGLQLLRKGYNVRGSSRSASAKEQLLEEAFQGFDSQYEHYVVPDMTAAGAFDDAVKGVHGIIHVASPIDMSLPDVDSFFRPAAGGVTSILDSAKSMAGPQLQSVVLTSSIGSVMDRFKYPADHVYDVDDWNTTFEEIVRKKFVAGLAYAASKAHAEKTFWAWRDQNQPAFAQTAVNPGLVMGPPITWPASPEKLNESLRAVWQVYSGEAKEMPIAIGNGTAIDVRDAAALHIWCMEHHKEADASRYIAVSGVLPPQGYADILREEYPGRDIIVGTPGAGYVPGTFEPPKGANGYVTDKMYAALGGKEKVIPLDKMILDSVKAFEQRWPGAARNTRLQSQLT